MSDISKELLSRHTGPLHHARGTVKMLGRMLQRSSDGIMIYESAEYYTSIFEDYGLQKANSVNAPGTSSLRPNDSVELLSSEGHSITDAQLVSYKGNRRCGQISATPLKCLRVTEAHQLHTTRRASNTDSGIYGELSTTSTS